jgi:mRNA export factor
MIVTGSWDKSVKYWDLRQSSAVATLFCQDKIYSMDVKDKLLVIATAERHINVVNLTEPTKFFKSTQSPLNHQTRIVSCSIDSASFAIGSTEGRCGFQYVAQNDQRYVSAFTMNL